MSKQTKKKPAKRNMTRLFFLNFGKVVLVAKLSFASAVLGGIMRIGILEQILISTGLIASGIGFIFGIICPMLCEEK